MVLIFICFGLGFFDKFNFVWLILAFVIGISLCYADSLKNIWASSPRLARHIAVILALTALSATLYFILPVLLHFHPARRHTMSLQMKWDGLLSTLSGVAVAHRIFGDAALVIRFTSPWLIVVDGLLALACLSFPMLDAEARENRKNGFFCLLIGLLIFLQDRYYASGRWSAPLLNDLSLASPGVCLPREIAIHTVRHRKPPSTCCSPFWFRGALSFRHKRS